MLKRQSHAPAHLFVDNSPYFITAAIHRKRPLLAEPSVKHALLEFLHKYFARYDWDLRHWVILDNHYHVLARSLKGQDLSVLIQSIHRASGAVIVEQTSCEKPIWWNYWDYCPRSEVDYATRVNYLLFNPVKHGYVTKLQDYPFSSFHLAFEEMGRDRLAMQFREYSAYAELVLADGEDDF